MADEARLNELLDLVEQARAEGDTDTEAKATAAYKRESAPQTPMGNPAQYGGAGGYNPMLGRLGAAVTETGNEFGVTEKNANSPLNVLGPLETMAQMGTGLGATILGGVSGIAQGAWNSVVPKRFEGQSAADSVREVQEKLTYQPRTGLGAGMSRAAGFPGELYGKGTDYLGGKTTDITGSPLLGAAIKTTGDAIPMAFGAKSVPRSGPRMAGNYKPTKFEAPTTKQLGEAATEAYKRADESGIAVKSESFDQMKASLADTLSKEGIDADLHPNASAALKRVTSESGPVSLQKLETLRRIALDAEDTPVKADAKKAGDIVDAIDEFVDNLSDSQLTSGMAKDAAALKEARALYTRKRKSEDIERLIRRAEYSPSGFENGLRIEFRSLAKNDRRFNRFSPEEKAAINKVAKGGPVENVLRWIGKAAPTGIVSGGLGTGAGFALGGPVGAAAVPAVGIAGRLGSKALTNRNARMASETMRRGPEPNADLLPRGSPTLPLELAQALVAQPRARSAATIRSEIDALVQKAGSQPGGPASASARAIWLELERLQAELASVESRGATQGGPGVPPNR
jgi:hypothetical protein